MLPDISFIFGRICKETQWMSTAMPHILLLPLASCFSYLFLLWVTSKFPASISSSSPKTPLSWPIIYYNFLALSLQFFFHLSFFLHPPPNNCQLFPKKLPPLHLWFYVFSPSFWLGPTKVQGASSPASSSTGQEQRVKSSEAKVGFAPLCREGGKSCKQYHVKCLYFLSPMQSCFTCWNCFNTYSKRREKSKKTWKFIFIFIYSLHERCLPKWGI